MSGNPFTMDKKIQDFVNSASGETSSKPLVRKTKEKGDFVNCQVRFPNNFKDRFNNYRKYNAKGYETKAYIVVEAIKEYIDYIHSDKFGGSELIENYCVKQTDPNTSITLFKLDRDLVEKLKIYRRTKAQNYETLNYLYLCAVDMWLTNKGY